MKESISKIVCLLLLSIACHPCVTEARSLPRKALFVSVIQSPQTLASRQSILECLEFCQKYHFDTVFVQVYRANKSWFRSTHADDSPYHECKTSMGEDAFAFFIDEAHKKDIQVHGWLNLMSLSANTQAPILKKYGSDILTQDGTPKKTLEDYKVDNQYFLEPGDSRVRSELRKIVQELVLAYPKMDGIQFDYIRYPDAHPVYGRTKENLRKFYHQTKILSPEHQDSRWKAFKIQQVTQLLRQLIIQAKKGNPNLIISNTGLMSYVRASEEAFQDWRMWVQEDMVDFVALMAYTDDIDRFGRYISDARLRIPEDKTVFAVGSYKFLHNPEAFSQQMQLASSQNFLGIAVLHYGDFIENPELEKGLA